MAGSAGHGTERINREVRRWTRVVWTFPDDNSVLMLVTTRLKYIVEHERGKSRHLDMSKLEEMDELEGKANGQKRTGPKTAKSICERILTVLPSPTFPRKFTDDDWGSRKINPNKICAECWPGAAFGPYWLLTERLRYETTPLLPALRDRVHVHGRRDDAHGGHCGSHPASGNSRAAGASRRHEQRRRQG